MDKKDDEFMDIVNNFFKYDYHDRGMLKWKGFFLSDHTAALKREFNKPKIVTKPKQSLELISKRLKLSWQYKINATIQLQNVSTDEELEQLEGIIQGYNGGMIILKDVEDKLHEIEIDNIRYVYVC
ncbi:hypothetical protein [Liquorilactobacillus oeni]|uniref:DNA-directed RNA polymerase beta subunit n=1 Tax=Liquorilactobacillus oeni DSM 19972 TaxID=1423777 RepID=A0A0R1M7M3_9LACO|nr:hypothetical protein [Liquorilactobacillus oeni]KRL04124.1 hypothetical protein FD46_GL001240 [Liquorilactobacillus oeni DSM 19972]